MLADWSPHKVGITKLLTETPIGDRMDLDQMEEQKLRSETDAIVEQLKKVIETARVKLEKVLDATLDKLQQEAIEENFGPNIENQVRNLSVVELIRLMDYPDEMKRRSREEGENQE
ncbi:hypothetical protein N9Z70_02755 [Mariniblastus sp.]|nr:hypothetical protein [Mariniblastus sp.]